MAAFTNTADGESNERGDIPAAISQPKVSEMVSAVEETVLRNAWLKSIALQQQMLYDESMWKQSLMVQAQMLHDQAIAEREAVWLQQSATYSSSGYSASAASGASGGCEGIPGELSSIAYMESTCNDNAQNASGATGLLQFMPGTFAGVCGTCCDIYSRECQIQAGQVMLDQGRACEWEVNHC